MNPENASDPIVTEPKPESRSAGRVRRPRSACHGAHAGSRATSPDGIPCGRSRYGRTEGPARLLRLEPRGQGNRLEVRVRRRDRDHRALRLCGKSTMVRCINRMHEEIPSARTEGEVLLDEIDLYDAAVDVVAVRRSIGMVFQKPNPFPTMSIEANVASGLRLTGAKRGGIEDKVRSALQGAGLWDEVKDRLGSPGAGPLGRTAAAAVHRAGARRRTRRCC